MISNTYTLIQACVDKESNSNIIKSNIYIISHMTSHMIDLTQLRQFHIIIYSKIDFSLIICYLIYLTFLINFYNQFFNHLF